MTSPDAAPQATEILRPLDQVEATPDKGAVQDAIEANMLDDVSNPQIQSTTSAVVSALTNGKS